MPRASLHPSAPCVAVCLRRLLRRPRACSHEGTGRVGVQEVGDRVGFQVDHNSKGGRPRGLEAAAVVEAHVRRRAALHPPSAPPLPPRRPPVTGTSASSAPSDLGTYREGLERLGVIPSTGAGAEWNGTFTPEQWAALLAKGKARLSSCPGTPAAAPRPVLLQAHLVGLCACCVVVYTIYAYGVYVCIRRGTQRERPQNARNGQNQRGQRAAQAPAPCCNVTLLSLIATWPTF